MKRYANELSMSIETGIHLVTSLRQDVHLQETMIPKKSTNGFAGTMSSKLLNYSLYISRFALSAKL